MLVCSAVSREYLAHVRVLADSLLDADPEARIAVCVVDDPDRELEVHPRAEVLTPQDVGIDRGELDRLVLMSDAHALASTIKPRLLHHLLDRGEPSAVLLDADICVYTPLRDLDDLAREHGLALSPHLHGPAPGAEGAVTESIVVSGGTFNSGCVAVGAGAVGFLDWWASRTARDCVIAPERGQFLEQLWLNLVPGMFPYHVLQDPGLNLNGWSLDGRDVGFEDGGPVLEDGAPVRFFHFLCNFDPERPELLSPHAPVEDWPGWPRPGERPGIERLCRDYARRLQEAGFGERQPYRYATLPDGTALDGGMRAAYRRALVDFERGRGAEPPNPFADGRTEEFVDWLREPPEDWAGEPVPRYLLGLRDDRKDLRVIFHDVPGRHTQPLLEWAAQAPGWAEPIWPGLAALDGDADLQGVVDGYGLPDSLSGKAALDVGTGDGSLALELERRGAERVVAVGDPLPGAGRVTEVFDRHGSKIEYRDGPLPDLAPETLGRFDVVLCRSPLRQGADPLLVLERIRSVTKELAIFEASPYPAAATPDGSWHLMAETLRLLCECTGFGEVTVHAPFELPGNRGWACAVHARPLAGADPGRVTYPSELREQREQALAWVRSLQTHLDSVHHSRSWRLTAPLRRVGVLGRRPR